MSVTRYDVFLSHNSADKPIVEELARRLVNEGLNPWLDVWNLIPGAPWQTALEEALAVCATCAVCIGPNGSGAWQNEEMRAAINRRVTDNTHGFRVIPVLLPGAERGERSKLPTFLSATTWVEFHGSLDDDGAFHRLVCGIRGIEPGPSPGEAISIDATPYRGLQVFDVQDCPFFFGREALVEWLLDDLGPDAQRQTENRFLAIVGPSGSGKSSLARAGLAAAIQQGKIAGSEYWPIAICKPGADPLESLAVAVSAATGDGQNVTAVRSLIADLRADPRTLHLVTRLALRDAPPERRLIVLVDQLEEIFTLCHDEAARKATIDTLLHAATVADGQTIVILTLRADFYGKCAAYPHLAAAFSDHQMLVGPMTRDELRRAIERPALLVGCEFEPGLVETLLDDVAHEPGGLPLLQHALLELWNRRAGRRLTHAAYHEIGGVEGALERRAEAVYVTFNPTEQSICRRIFLRLAQLGEGTEDTRRRATVRELLPATGATEAFDTVLRKLTAPEARLVTIQGTLNSADKTGDGTLVNQHVVEVAHEALIRSWSRLRSWLDENRAALRIHRQMTEAATEWMTNQRDASYLYRGARLIEAQEWATKHADDLNQAEQAFLEASVTARDAEQRAAQRRVRRTIGGLVSALVIISLFSGVAVYYWQSASTAARVDRGRLLVQQGQQEHAAHPLLGLRLALEGLLLAPQEKPSVAALAAHARLLQLSEDSNRFVVSPDSTMLVLMRTGMSSEIRRTADGQVIATFTSDGDITGIHFSPDSHAFIVSYTGTPNELRRTANGQLIASFTGDVDFLGNLLSLERGLGIYFSADSQAFVVDYIDKPRELRRTADGQIIPNFTSDGDIAGIHFSPDSQTFVAASNAKPHELRRTADGQLIASFTGELAYPRISFSPDGHAFIVSYTGTPHELRRTADGQIIATFTGELTYPGITFSPDGRAFVASYKGERHELRRTANGQLITSFTGELRASGIHFSPDSQTFIVSYGGKPNELRRTTDGQLITTFTGELESPGIHFSPDNRAFVAGYIFKPGELRRTTDGQLIATLNDNLDSSSIPFSPNGHAFITSYIGKPNELRRTSDGQIITTFTGDVDIAGITFSPDNHALVVTYADKENELWDLTDTPHPLAILGLSTDRTVFHPNLQRLVVRYVTGEVYLLDLAWLRAMDGAPINLPQEELIQISCQAVWESGLWTADDDAALRRALGTQAPQACQ
jgi:WD40 repeat protein/energy-coupling factor transporter ATP-binding protein EcfA2